MEVYCCTQPARAEGLTLVELVTTLAVLIVSLSIIVPAWATLTERTQITSAANRLLGNLNFARNTAVTRGRTITLCPSSDGIACSGDPFAWHGGYIIFEDRNADRARADGEPLLHVEGRQPARLRLHSTVGRPAVRFQADGAAWGTNTTFSICQGEDAAANRAVILLGTGRARVDRLRPGNKPVTCS